MSKLAPTGLLLANSSAAPKRPARENAQQNIFAGTAVQRVPRGMQRSPARSADPRAEMARCRPRCVRSSTPPTRASQAAPGDADTWGNFALLLHSYADARPPPSAATHARRSSRRTTPTGYYLHGTALGRSSDTRPCRRPSCAGQSSLDPRAILPRLRLADALARQECVGSARNALRAGDSAATRATRRRTMASARCCSMAATLPPRSRTSRRRLEYGGDFRRRTCSAGARPTRRSATRARAGSTRRPRAQSNARLPLDPELQHQLDTLVESDRPVPSSRRMKFAYAGRVDDAIRACEAALARVPNNPDAHVTLIGLYGAKHDPSRAPSSNFKIAITSRCRIGESLVQYRLRAPRIRIDGQAITAFQRAIELRAGRSRSHTTCWASCLRTRRTQRRGARAVPAGARSRSRSRACTLPPRPRADRGRPVSGGLRGRIDPRQGLAAADDGHPARAGRRARAARRDGSGLRAARSREHSRRTIPSSSPPSTRDLHR